MIEPIYHESYTIDDVHVSIYEYPEQTESRTSSENTSRSGFRRMRTETSTSPTFQWSEESISEDRVPSSVDRLGEELVRFLAERRYDRAIDSVDEIIRKLELELGQEPESIMNCLLDCLLISKATYCALNDQPERALEIHKAVKEKYETAPDELMDGLLTFHGGFFYLLNGEQEKAVAEFRKIENIYEEGVAVLLLSVLEKKIGVSLFNLENRDPQLTLDSTEESLILVAQGRYREAIDHFDNRWYEDLAYAAFCHAMLGEWDECETKLEQAMGSNGSGYHKVQFVKTVISLSQGDFDRIDTASIDPFSTPLLMTVRYFEKNR